MIVNKLRLILSLEVVAYYFAAPYIILLGLDEKRGLLEAATSMNYRLLAYALLVGIYPFLLMIVSPYVGRRVDQNRSKISVLRNIHLANSTCYMLLAVAAWLHSLPLGILALAIPGVVGCASPVGKSLIASLTKPEERVAQYAKLSFLKGLVKLTIPLLGALIFKSLFNESYYWPLFTISSIISLSCFFYSFSFDDSCLQVPCSDKSASCSTVSPAPATLFKELVIANWPLFLVFVLMITGYAIFVKFTPFVLFETVGDNPSIVNYFASLVGLAYSLNQFIVARYSRFISAILGFLPVVLCLLALTLSATSYGPLWFVGFFGILFCFSVLNTCMEARLSLQAIAGNQGTVQGIVYSVENWGYIVSPILGSAICALSRYYPLYFVAFIAFVSAIVFAYSELFYKRLARERNT